jgi:hypothetical protein
VVRLENSERRQRRAKTGILMTFGFGLNNSENFAATP